MHMHIRAFICDTSREELKDINKGRLTAYIQTYFIDWT